MGLLSWVLLMGGIIFLVVCLFCVLFMFFVCGCSGKSFNECWYEGIGDFEVITKIVVITLVISIVCFVVLYFK